MISFQDRIKVLKGYLGEYYINISSKEIKEFSELYKEFNSRYVYSKNSEYLFKVGCYYLLAFGYQDYKSIISYDLVTSFLSSSNNLPFYEVPSKFLIVKHLSSTVTNKQLEALLSQTIEYREVKGKKTLVLTGVDLPLVKALPIWKDPVRKESVEKEDKNWESF